MKKMTHFAQNVSPRVNAEDDDKFNYKAVVLKYLRLWPLFVFSVAGAVLVAFLVNQLTPPVYKIQGKFLVNEESNTFDIFDHALATKKLPPPKGLKIANESIIIKSRTIADRALEQLSFDVEYFEDGRLVAREIYGKNTPITVEVDWNHPQLTNGKIRIKWTDNRYYELEFEDNEYEKFVPGESRAVTAERPTSIHRNLPFGEWIEYPYFRLLVSHTGRLTSGTSVIKLRDRESLLQQYTGDDLQVVPVDKTSSILSLTLDTHHPEKGSEFLNALMNVFLNIELEEKNSIASNTVHFLDNQLSGISDSLTYSQNKLEKFRSVNRTYNITSEGNSLYEELTELEKTLSQQRFKLEYFRKLQEFLLGEDYSHIVVPSGLGIDDPVLNGLIEELVRSQSDKSRFLASQTENSPAVIEVNRKIQDTNRSIQESLKNMERSTGLLIRDLTRRIGRIESQFGKLPGTEQDLVNIKRRYSLNESIYTFLLQRRAEAAISLASNKPSNKIIEYAVPNTEPVRLRPMLNYFLALLLGLIFPIAVVSVREFFSFKVKDLKEVEQRLVVPVVGWIGQNLNHPPLVVLDRPRARITEAFRALRTNLDFISHTDKHVSILVTSSISGEGKSFCSVNLASAYSILGKRTVVVECDMRKPFAFKGFTISNDRGLSNFLSGQASRFEEIMQRTEYPNLDVLVPGPVPPNPSELLISDRFKGLLEDLKKEYDVVILDSPPLGLTNETLYLTRMADVSLFVLRQNYSDKSFFEDINALKEKKGIKRLYGVVNDIQEKYLNHKGYGYGYYADDEERATPFKRIHKAISNKAAI